LENSSTDVQFDPQGLETVQIWRQIVPASIPLVAIGGINTIDRVAQVRAAGADSVAVIGAVTQHRDDPAHIATALMELNKAMSVSYAMGE
jgi:thiamine monophosphate synthase